jgi:hypothetical protein
MDEVNDKERYEYQIERIRRFRMAVAIVPAFVAALLYLMLQLPPAEYLLRRLAIDPVAVSLLPIILLLFSGAGVLLIYLQTGFKRDTEAEISALRYDNEISRLRRDVYSLKEGSSPQVAELRDEIASLRDGLLEVKSSLSQFTGNQKSELIKILQQQIESEAASGIIEEIRKQVAESHKLSMLERETSRHFEDSRSRLSQELSALGRRGNLNLALGIVTTVSGLIFLGIFVITTNPNAQDPWSFAIHFIPRLTLVVFIEVFAYFFLRLYKGSLAEIKYFQNELTNLEAKFVALKVVCTVGDTATANDVVSKLASTERNYILEKNQTTVDLEHAKLERETLKELINRLTDVFSKKS